MNDINLIILFILITTLLILLLINFIVFWRMNRPANKDSRCINCQYAEMDEVKDIRCRHKGSKFYRSMMDDYSICERWRRMRGD